MREKKHLKWVGSKEQTAEAISFQLTAGRRLVEPFCGSARIWMAAQEKYDSVLLADVNEDLIDFYRWVKADCESFIACAEYWFNNGAYNDSENYYLLRKLFNIMPRGIEKSALFLYFNWHGYNGLCRYNQSGGYNVPFGSYTKPEMPAAGIRKLAVSLINAELVCVDWRRLLSSFLRQGDVIYLDPPYLGTDKSFTAYSGKKFTLSDQEGLARAAERLKVRGYDTFISNSDSPATRELYANATTFHSFTVQRLCAPKAEQRIKVNELLAGYICL